MSDSLVQYFPLLTDIQRDKLSRLRNIYDRWNSLINVISRKDMDNFFIHHVLHSLSVAKVINFIPGTTILDVGTGGGFPGIPLSIVFPDSEFTLLDSIGKKIKVVTAVMEELELTNVNPVWKRIEEEKGRYHFVVSRAVTDFRKFVSLTSKNIDRQSNNILKNGIIYLLGGDLTEEKKFYGKGLLEWNVSYYFREEYFETKKIVYLRV